MQLRKLLGHAARRSPFPAVWKRVLADRKSTSYELRVGASTVFCLEIDEDWRVFVVVSTTGYPSRHVFSGTSDSSEWRTHGPQHATHPTPTCPSPADQIPSCEVRVPSPAFCAHPK